MTTAGPRRSWPIGFVRLPRQHGAGSASTPDSPSCAVVCRSSHLSPSPRCRERASPARRRWMSCGTRRGAHDATRREVGESSRCLDAMRCSKSHGGVIVSSFGRLCSEVHRQAPAWDAGFAPLLISRGASLLDRQARKRLSAFSSWVGIRYAAHYAEMGGQALYGRVDEACTVEICHRQDAMWAPSTSARVMIYDDSRHKMSMPPPMTPSVTPVNGGDMIGD